MPNSHRQRAQLRSITIRTHWGLPQVFEISCLHVLSCHRAVLLLSEVSHRHGPRLYCHYDSLTATTLLPSISSSLTTAHSRARPILIFFVSVDMGFYRSVIWRSRLRCKQRRRRRSITTTVAMIISAIIYLLSFSENEKLTVDNSHGRQKKAVGTFSIHSRWDKK